jgi:hypothetical protein
MHVEDDAARFVAGWQAVQQVLGRGVGRDRVPDLRQATFNRLRE